MQGRKKVQRVTRIRPNNKKKGVLEKRNNTVKEKREPPLENGTNKMGKQKIKRSMKSNSKGKRKKCRGEGKKASTAPKNEH